MPIPHLHNYRNNLFNRIRKDLPMTTEILLVQLLQMCVKGVTILIGFGKQRHSFQKDLIKRI